MKQYKSRENLIHFRLLNKKYRTSIIKILTAKYSSTNPTLPAASMHNSCIIKISPTFFRPSRTPCKVTCAHRLTSLQEKPTV